MNDLDIILPVHNEKETVAQVLEEWAKILKIMDISYSFIVCEDGSTDGTQTVLHNLGHIYPILLNQRIHRRGYGQAVIDGIFSSTGKYILCIDSDGQCDPNDFPKLWKQRNIETVVIGWRLTRQDTWLRKIYSKLFKILFSILFPKCPRDPSTPYVLFQKKKIFPYIRYLTFLREGFWWGFIGTCLKFSIPIKELPINHKARLKGKTQVYALRSLPLLAIRNIVGLIKLRFVE